MVLGRLKNEVSAIEPEPAAEVIAARHPGDAVIGSLLGASIGALVASVARRWLGGLPRRPG